MSTVTLATLRTRARQRADMVNSGFISDTELNSYINASYAELYDLLVSKYGEDYFASNYTFSTNGADSYSLPADFYKLLGVDLQLNSNQWCSLKRFEFNERNVSKIWDISLNENLRYRLMGNNIYFQSTPNSNLSVKLWYVPLPTALALDTDSFAGINGFEEYVVIDAAIKMLAKEESDTSQLNMEKGQMKLRIEQMAEARDEGQPAKVQDTSALSISAQFGVVTY